MKTINLVFMLAALMLGACADSKPDASMHRYTNAVEKYSIDAPDGWSLREERGSTVFVAPGADKQTIAVRSAPRARELVEGQTASPDDIVDATEHVLAALPQGHVLRRSKIKNPTLIGSTFAVEFVPNGLTETYQRIHSVLVGKDRVYHVIYTAPSSTEFDDDVVQQVINGFREEV